MIAVAYTSHFPFRPKQQLCSQQRRMRQGWVSVTGARLRVPQGTAGEGGWQRHWTGKSKSVARAFPVGREVVLGRPR